MKPLNEVIIAEQPLPTWIQTSLRRSKMVTLEDLDARVQNDTLFLVRGISVRADGGIQIALGLLEMYKDGIDISKISKEMLELAKNMKPTIEDGTRLRVLRYYQELAPARVEYFQYNRKIGVQKITTVGDFYKAFAEGKLTTPRDFLMKDLIDAAKVERKRLGDMVRRTLQVKPQIR